MVVRIRTYLADVIVCVYSLIFVRYLMHMAVPARRGTYVLICETFLTNKYEDFENGTKNASTEKPSLI